MKKMSKLAKLRKEKNLTQLQLAKLTGLSRVRIARHETGFSQIRLMDLETASKIAKVLGVHAEDLLEDSE